MCSNSVPSPPPRSSGTREDHPRVSLSPKTRRTSPFSLAPRSIHCWGRGRGRPLGRCAPAHSVSWQASQGLSRVFGDSWLSKNGVTHHWRRFQRNMLTRGASVWHGLGIFLVEPQEREQPRPPWLLCARTGPRPVGGAAARPHPRGGRVPPPQLTEGEWGAPGTPPPVCPGAHRGLRRGHASRQTLWKQQPLPC